MEVMNWETRHISRSSILATHWLWDLRWVIQASRPLHPHMQTGYNVVVKCTDLGARLPRFKSHLGHRLPAWVRASYQTSLDFSYSIDILGRIILGGEGRCPVHCSTFSSIPGLYSLDASSTHIGDNQKISPDLSKGTLGEISLPIEKHC